MSSNGRALIIGGGVGGLAACVALTRAGWTADVFEKASAIRDRGSGLAIASNAVLALRAIGIEKEVVEVGEKVHTLELRAAGGARLGRISLEVISRRLGAPSLAISRADLIGALREACPTAQLHAGRALLRAEDRDGTVAAIFEDGSLEEGDILIGADGIRSTVRDLLHGPSTPTFAGTTSWRGMAPTTPDGMAEGVGGQTWGRGAVFGFGPVGRGRVAWWCTQPAAEGEKDGPEGPRARLLEIFGSWHAPVASLMRLTPEEEIIRTDLHVRPPPPLWGRGRQTLIGDAAHLMTPELGQGACQAIVDAAELGRCLAGVEAADAAAGLRKFESRSHGRVLLAMRESARFGRISQVQSRGGCAMRDAGIRLTPAFVRHRSFALLLRRGSLPDA